LQGNGASSGAVRPCKALNIEKNSAFNQRKPLKLVLTL
jgi:hypothetical protein